MNSRSPANVTQNEKVFRFLSYLSVFLMMACAVLAIGTFFRQILPEWHSGIIASIMLFIIIDRLYTYQHLKSLTPFSSEWAIAVGAQWVLILLVSRLLLSYANGVESFQADLSLFARGEIAELVTPEFVASILLAILVWFLTGRFLDLLDEIGLAPAQTAHEGPAPIQSENVPAHQRLVNLVFGLGIGLVVLTALALVDYRTIVSNVEGLPNIEFRRFTGGEAGVLLYFIFGLALLSLSRLLSLQSYWNQLRIPVSSVSLYRQWGMYSLFFLLILVVIVGLLPAGDSLGLFSVLGALFDFLITALLFIGQLILSLLFVLISLPFLLFRGDAPPLESLPSAPPLPNLPALPDSPAPSNPAWPLIRSILLWGSLAAFVIFTFIQFVKQHGGIRAALRNSRITNWLILAWQWLYKNVGKTGGTLSRAIADGWESIVSRLERKRVLPRPDLIRLRSLDPRRQIYFFYLAMVRRGAEQGLTRKPSQTPSEYAAALGRALPESGEDIESITEAFVQARYSRRHVDSNMIERVKATWGRIRRALQGNVKSEQKLRK
jgi:hypothetical protein